jgi:phosphomannomutase
MEVKNEIFHAYDIRGIFPHEVSIDLAYALGHAFPGFINAKKVAVGNDDRKSSQPLKESLIKGLVSAGVDVIDIGASTTPLFYYAVAHHNFDGGIMVSASHNPPQYNGFKLVKRGARPVSGIEIQDLKEIIERGHFPSNVQPGSVKKVDFMSDYVDFLLSSLSQNISGIKVVMDAGNASSSFVLPRVKESVNFELRLLFWGVNGEPPKRSPNPLEEGALERLKNKVRETGANFGVAFDDDADRAIFIDEEGRFIPPDMITALFISAYLKNKPSGRFIYDVRTSHVVPEIIKQGGGEPILCPVGRTNIQRKMWQLGAVFAGEFSGHYYFKNLGNIDDGLFAALKVAEIVSKEGKGLSQLIRPFQKYYKSHEINLQLESPDQVFSKLEEIYKYGKISNLDGLTIEFGNWWFNIRASNTEPVVRLTIEAKTKEIFKEKQAELLSILK